MKVFKFEMTVFLYHVVIYATLELYQNKENDFHLLYFYNMLGLYVSNWKLKADFFNGSVAALVSL